MNTKSKARRGVSRKPAYIVPAVDRAARILSLLRNEGRAMTIAEIADTTRWHKSSVHKLLVTLNHHGLLDRDAVTKGYSLGIALSEYGRIASSRSDILHAAKSFLKALADYSGETAALAVLRGTQMIIVDVEESPAQLRVSLTLGMRSPATATSNGKAVIAYLPESQASEIIQAEGLLAATPNSITKLDHYTMELAGIRERGYATDFEEYQKGIVGVSAPVFDSRNQPIGALSVAGPASRMTKDKIRNCGKKVKEITAQLSAMIR